MRVLLILLGVLSFNASSANTMDQCKADGELARRIIEFRQTKNDLEKSLSRFKDNQVIVFDSFSEDHVDVEGQLEIRINARGSRVHRERMKHNEMDAKRDNIINAFKVKYIAKCLQE